MSVLMMETWPSFILVTTQSRNTREASDAGCNHSSAVCVWWLQAAKQCKLAHILEKWNYVSMIQPSVIAAAEAVGFVFSHSWWHFEPTYRHNTCHFSVQSALQYHTRCHNGNGLRWGSDCSDHSQMMKTWVKRMSHDTVTFLGSPPWHHSLSTLSQQWVSHSLSKCQLCWNSPASLSPIQTAE